MLYSSVSYRFFNQNKMWSSYENCIKWLSSRNQKTRTQKAARLVYLLYEADRHWPGDNGVEHSFLNATLKSSTNTTYICWNATLSKWYHYEGGDVQNKRSDIQVCWKERRNGIFDEAPVRFSTESWHEIFTWTTLGLFSPEQLSPKVWFHTSTPNPSPSRMVFQRSLRIVLQLRP